MNLENMGSVAPFLVFTLNLCIRPVEKSQHSFRNCYHTLVNIIESMSFPIWYSSINLVHCIFILSVVESVQIVEQRVAFPVRNQMIGASFLRKSISFDLHISDCSFVVAHT